LYELAAIAIRRGLEIGALSEADLWSTDREAWDKLQSCPDDELQAALRMVSPDTQFTWDEAAPTFWVSTKLRTIDPHVLVDGHAIPLSELDPDFAVFRQKYLQSKQGKWPVRVKS
jgi:hypothetical protein